MASAAEWARRVASWRRSGLSAEEFASGKDYRAKTLAWWSSELKRRERSRPARGGENALVRGAGEVRFARVHVVEPPGGRLVVRVAGVDVVVESGFDERLLAEVVRVLKGAQ